MFEVLLWAMEHADSSNPETATRWAAFISFTTPLAPAMSAAAMRDEEVVLALLVPSLMHTPISIQEEAAVPRVPEREGACRVGRSCAAHHGSSRWSAAWCASHDVAIRIHLG